MSAVVRTCAMFREKKVFYWQSLMEKPTAQTLEYKHTHICIYTHLYAYIFYMYFLYMCIQQHTEFKHMVYTKNLKYFYRSIELSQFHMHYPLFHLGKDWHMRNLRHLAQHKEKTG